MNEARFWSHVERTNSCWLWTGLLCDRGFGRVRVSGRLRSAHRIAYELARGPIPADTVVRHSCGERACCRPDHLLLYRVTRLTPKQVESIRRSFLSLRKLAERHGVSHVRIWQIKRSRATA